MHFYYPRDYTSFSIQQNPVSFMFRSTESIQKSLKEIDTTFLQNIKNATSIEEVERLLKIRNEIKQKFQ